MKSSITIHEHWEVRVRDIDPDTGSTSQDKAIAITMSEQWAGIICRSLGQLDEEPNREYYLQKIDHLEIKN